MRDHQGVNREMMEPKTGKPFLLWLSEDLHTDLQAGTPRQRMAMHWLLIRFLGLFADFVRRYRGRPIYPVIRPKG